MQSPVVSAKHAVGSLVLPAQGVVVRSRLGVSPNSFAALRTAVSSNARRLPSPIFDSFSLKSGAWKPSNQFTLHASTLPSLSSPLRKTSTT
eukprot:8812721-Pyramimonas_sp.AAC.1